MLAEFKFDDSALNWPGSWGSPSDPSDGFSEENASIVSVVSMVTLPGDEFEQPAPVDACEAAEMETARMRQLADAKARQLQEFQAREAARVRAYRRLARLQAAAAGTSISSQLASDRRAKQSVPASPRQQQQQQPQDWETLRLSCHRESLAARRALVGRRLEESPITLKPPSQSPTPPPPPLRLFNGFEQGDEDLAVSTPSCSSGRRKSDRASSIYSSSAAVVAAASSEVRGAAAEAAAARRQRAAQRSLSALSEREAARRWRLRRESAARARRVKQEGEAMALEQRQQQQSQNPPPESTRTTATSAVITTARTASDNGDKEYDETIATVTELTHTVLTLATTDRAPVDRLANLNGTGRQTDNLQETQPTNGPELKNHLAFLQSLQAHSNGSNGRHRKLSSISSNSTSSGSSLDVTEVAAVAETPAGAAVELDKDDESAVPKWRWLQARCRHLGLTVPPLCPCNPSDADAFSAAKVGAADCAVNCMFYNSPGLLLAAVTDFVRSADHKFPPLGADWWRWDAEK